MVVDRVRQGLPPRSVVSVTGLPLIPAVRQARANGMLRRQEMFAAITPNGVQSGPRKDPSGPRKDSCSPLSAADPVRGTRQAGKHIRVATSEEVATLTVKIKDLGGPDQQIRWR